MGSRRLSALVLAALCVGALGNARADLVATDCGFGGPTPGFHAMRIDLPQGSSFLTLELGGKREDLTVRPVNEDGNWHLAQGIFVLNVATLEIEAYRIDSQGMAPRRIVVRPDGTTAVQQKIGAPDIRYVHHATKLRDGLAPGSYYVIAFGSDSGRNTFPNEWWSAGVQIEGTQLCGGIGTGSTFDLDHTDFTGGMQVYAPGVGVAEGISHSFGTARRLVVGLMDAETQASSLGDVDASSVSLAYETPTGSGTVSEKLIPFVSSGGVYRFEASYRGVYPVVAVAGLAIDLP